MRPVIVYDGECRFCRAQTRRIQRWDRRDAFEYVPRQTPGLAGRFPVLEAGDFNAGMRLVSRDGSVHVGADAVYEIARRLPICRWLAWVYRVPIAHGMLRRAYGWIAANRGRLGGTDAVCLECEDREGANGPRVA